MKIFDDMLEAARRNARHSPQTRHAEAGASSDEDVGMDDRYCGWWQIALPHCRPSDGAAVQELQCDGMTLCVEPGSHLVPGGVEPAGVPFGAIAKLVLVYLQSEALRTGRRDVALGRSLDVVLGRLGVPIGKRTAPLVREQVQRLSYCRLTLHKAENGRTLLVNQNIMDVTAASDSGEGRGKLLVRTVRLDGEFFRQLKQYAVALDNAVLQQLHESMMALDVYCWLATSSARCPLRRWAAGRRWPGSSAAALTRRSVSRSRSRRALPWSRRSAATPGRTPPRPA